MKVSMTCPNCGINVDPDTLIPAGDQKVCPACRDAYLQQMKEGLLPGQGAEAFAIRTSHVNHERSIRSVGLLYYLLGVLSIASALLALAAKGEGGPTSGVDSLNTLFMVGFGAISLVMGYGFRKLRKWARLPGIVLSVLGLMAFPLGTLISAYLLYLFLSSKGRMVFSAEYQQIIATTPDMKARTSPIVWVLVVVIVLFLLFAVPGITGFVR